MGVYLSHPRTEKSSAEGENGRLKYGVSSMQGWRSTMEDAHAAYPDLDNGTSFFGVYDGHGGKAVAKFCAKYLHEQVLKSEAYTAGDLGDSLQKTFLRMDEMMCGQRGSRELASLGDKMQRVSSMLEGLIWSPKNNEANGKTDDWSTEQEPGSDYTGPTSGCTACVAIIRENKLLVANAGDSRCVLSRGGRAYPMSKDHKPAHEHEKERILKAGGYVQFGRVNGSLNLSRAIGDMELKQNKSLPAERQIVTAYPDVTAVDLHDEDEFLILACDGIWDCMSSQEAVDFVRKELSSESKLSAVCEKVFDKCLAPAAGGEGCDNMTMILVQFKKIPNQGASSEKPPEPSANETGPEEDKDRKEACEPQANTESDPSV